MWGGGKTTSENGSNQSVPKPSGFDMMVQTLLRNMGITPDMLQGYINRGTELAQQFVGAVTGMNQRIANLEAELLYHRTLLETIARNQASAQLHQMGGQSATTESTGKEVGEWTGQKQ